MDASYTPKDRNLIDRYLREKLVPLLRIAFWLMVLILLMPSGREQQNNVYSIASATMRDLGRFCERNPATCQHGETALHSFVAKAKVGGETVFNFIKKRVSARYTDYQSDAAAEWYSSSAVDRKTGLPSDRSWTRKSRHTLTNQDLQPQWMAPLSGADA